MIILSSTKVKPIWGSVIPKPITDLPDDVLKVRYRMRNNNFAVAYLRYADGIEKWILAEDVSGNWKLGLRQGQNLRVSK